MLVLATMVDPINIVDGDLSSWLAISKGLDIHELDKPSRGGTLDNQVVLDYALWKESTSSLRQVLAEN